MKSIINNKNIRLIRKLNWEEVFAFWYEGEGKMNNWIELAKKRGFASWAEWRLNVYAVPFDCRNADWSLYEVSDPAETVSKFYGGPFRTWVEKYYGAQDKMRFEDLVKIPELKENKTIIQMSKDFPKEKIITCLSLGDNIFTIEGMHRSCALALIHQEGRELGDKLLFAIGVSKKNKLPVVGGDPKK